MVAPRQPFPPPPPPGQWNKRRLEKLKRERQAQEVADALKIEDCFVGLDCALWMCVAAAVSIVLWGVLQEWL